MVKMRRRIVKLRNGKYAVQTKVLHLYWVSGIWDGISYIEGQYETVNGALEHIDEIETMNHACDVETIIGEV